jgi:3'-phosphoadenosine 5'-phosphosulfate (PAPS) 3'-phosphatase
MQPASRARAPDDAARRVRLRDLLSVCLRLCHGACAIIRDVQLARERAGENAGLRAELKDPSDPRSYMTVADTRAQQHIMAGLRARFGEALEIVGEEEEEDGEADACAGAGSEASRDLDPEYVFPTETEELILADLCVFIDPLDGTREFVEGRLEAVQCLLGVAYRGRPVAGVVGVPFLRMSDAQGPCTCTSSRPHVLYGAVGSPSGVAGLPLPEGPAKLAAADAAGITLAISGDLGKNTAAEAVPKVLFGDGGTGCWQDTARLLRVGGCGFKILKVMNGEADIAVMNMKTSLWDTCAPEALVRSAGGSLTTLFGWPIEHSSLHRRGKPTSAGYGNRFGVVVTGKLFAARSSMSHQVCAKRAVYHAKRCEIARSIALLTPAGSAGAVSACGT